MEDLLTAGSTVAVVSPSVMLSDRDMIDLQSGVNYLQDLGLNVKVCDHIFNGLKLSPHSDQQKAAQLMAAFADPEVKAIFAFHGGASSQRLLPLLDFDVIRANPKPLIGFSDTTAVQLGIYSQTANPFVSGFLLEYAFRFGPKVNQLVDLTLQNYLRGKPFKAHGGITLNPGLAEGILLGECLTEIAFLSGTTYFPSLENTILLIEDECERPYKIDMMLTQLSQRPDFAGVKGIIFGQFSDCDPVAHTHGTVDTVITNFSQQLNIPVIKDFEFGHFPRRHVIPMGVRFRMDATDCTLEQIA